MNMKANLLAFIYVSYTLQEAIRQHNKKEEWVSKIALIFSGI